MSKHGYIDEEVVSDDDQFKNDYTDPGAIFIFEKNVGIKCVEEEAPIRTLEEIESSLARDPEEVVEDMYFSMLEYIREAYIHMYDRGSVLKLINFIRFGTR